MQTLTICQPYAELIARGDQLVENRMWGVNHRGPLAIHAGKSRAWLDSAAPEPGPLAFGAVVAVVRLAACVRLAQLERWLCQPGHRDRFGWLTEHEHATGPVLWVLEEPRRLLRPIAARGQQGMWDWEPPGRLKYAADGPPQPE